MSDDLSHRKVLFVLPQARFKDEEFDIPKRFLERKKCLIKVTCPAKKPSFGMGGMRAVADYAFEDVNVAEYDLVYFVGGMGSKDLFDHPGAHKLARAAVEADKIVVASSMAPIILGRAGLLQGREATVYFSETKALEATGAKYSQASISVDGKIITCKGTEAVEKLALHLIKLLTELSIAEASGQAG